MEEQDKENDEKERDQGSEHDITVVREDGVNEVLEWVGGLVWGLVWGLCGVEAQHYECSAGLLSMRSN